ncbi:roadblock/LC7 domain-containing protein [Demequina aurantiaca]|uniref:roadblock/LC7 domain-containing protein n=1 Tax=Demequina aurantiaca TaxID=676200 RepID=UPI000781CB90|nr:roadblock/LC7 domain-containing protein [Demequina aurantiaca]
MITRESVALLTRELRQFPGVTRVLLAGRDGVPFYDDLALAARDHAAAATASALGVGALICDGVKIGAMEGGVVFGRHGVLVYRPLESDFVLAVIATSTVDLADLYRRMRREARILDQAARKE